MGELWSSFAEVVDVQLRSPVRRNCGDEVDIALVALAMLPVKVRRLSLVCKSGDSHPRLASYVRQNRYH